MTDHSKSEATLTVVSSLNDIARDDWDACANPEGLARRLGPGESSNQHGEIAPGAQPDCEREMPTIGDARSGLEYNPFLSHDFLWSLEESGSATRKTGWLGQHLVLAGADDRPAAILPCYLKSHSMGEYVFDGGWANAFEQAGGRYYPKLQVSVPFTPVTGRRLLVRPGPDAEQAGRLEDGVQRRLDVRGRRGRGDLRIRARRGGARRGDDARRRRGAAHARREG